MAMSEEMLRDIEVLMDEEMTSEEIAGCLGITRQRAAGGMRTIKHRREKYEQINEEKKHKEEARKFSFELAPCPFCGGAADLKMQFSNTGVETYIICSECSAQVARSIFMGPEGDVTLLQDVISRWNQRYVVEEEGESNERIQAD